jgi:hypothetical protein
MRVRDNVKIDKPGLYPFVSHAFAAVDEGQVGLLNVGNVHGTMSHDEGSRKRCVALEIRSA